MTEIRLKWVVLALAALCTLGAVLTAVGDPYALMVTGRLLFGLGNETLYIALLVGLAQWFHAGGGALAIALFFSIARIGVLRRRYVDQLGRRHLCPWTGAAIVARRRADGDRAGDRVRLFSDRSAVRAPVPARAGFGEIRAARPDRVQPLILVHIMAQRAVRVGVLSSPLDLLDPVFSGREGYQSGSGGASSWRAM